jgi:hypothetical protein
LWLRRRVVLWRRRRVKTAAMVGVGLAAAELGFCWIGFFFLDGEDRR